MKLRSAVLVVLLVTPMTLCCPVATEIEPCVCSSDINGYSLICNDIKSTAQLNSIFSVNFPEKVFYSLDITYGNMDAITALPAGVSFEHISLDGNSYLSFVSQEVFVDSYNTLREFYVYDSALTELSFLTDKLPLFTNLKSLTVEHSPVKLLDSLQSTTLDYVDIYYTLLESITPDTFLGAPNVTNIVLEHTNITALEAGTFAVDDTVDNIYLSYNKISVIEPGAFYLPAPSDGTTEEMVLKLHYNSLTRLQPDTFPFTDRPYHISLEINNIDTIDAGAFVMPDSTEHFRVELYLFKNALTSVDETVWGEIFPYITFLELDDNPLECGCDVAWIVNNEDYMSVIYKDATCADGTAFAELDPADFALC